MKKINKKSKEGIKRKIAFFSMIALLLNVAMAGVFAPAESVLHAEEEQMCEAAVDVVMIIDRSRSMGYDSPTRLSQAKIAANSFLDNLETGDQSALVSYASEAIINKELSGSHSVTQMAVDNLNASGGTNIGDAIYFSNAELGSVRANSQAVKVAILLTDGRATCPYYDYPLSSCGFVEDDEDIQYAIDAANAAANAGYKVFTIGLGATAGQNSINEPMLQKIASITGAEYYHAPTSGDLEGIYAEISQQLCDYGSISGYKYNDTDNNEDINGEPIIAGWEINLNGDAIDTQLTDEDGYYTFVGLEPGTYTVTETIPAGWIQTYKPDPNEFIINWGDHLINKNFGNYFPECGNNILDDNEDCDGDNPQACVTDNGYAGYENCVECSWDICETEEFCGDEIVNGNEDCDDGPQGSPTCTSECVSIGISCQASEVSRECVADGEAEVFYKYYPVGCDYDYTEIEEDPTCACVETEVAGECVDDIYREFTFTYNYDYCEERESENREDETCDGEDPYCGDGVCNNNETCSSCPQDCGQCGGGGGGGGYIPPTIIKITDEKADCLENGEAVITWKTNTTTTNQVAYGDNSIITFGDAPEYGYSFVNEESGSMWTEHSVTITGLTDGVMHYFRPVADRNGSEEVVGEEVFCVFEEGEVKGTEAPAPVEECNYLLEYIKLGADNNPVEVEKLERFLNEFEGENLAVNGVYEQVDFDAVSRFQEKYLGDVLAPWSHNKATGYVYITTKKKINEIYCQREFPLTAEQEAEVALFSERVLDMFTENGSAEASDSGEDSALEDVEEDEYGRVGGVEDEVDENKDKSEDEDKDKEGEDEVEDEAEDESETFETESRNGVAIQDIQEEGDNDSEYAGDRYSKYFPAFLIAIIIIAGGAWHFFYRRKGEEETK